MAGNTGSANRAAMSSRRKRPDGVTIFGFKWGPMKVERTAADDRLGWILTVRDENGEGRAEIRVSPKGQKWTIKAL